MKKVGGHEHNIPPSSLFSSNPCIRHFKRQLPLAGANRSSFIISAHILHSHWLEFAASVSYWLAGFSVLLLVIDKIYKDGSYGLQSIGLFEYFLMFRRIFFFFCI